MGLLLYGLPILLGFVVGYFFTLPIALSVSFVALAIGIYGLWSTRNAEIGGLVGVIAIFETAIFAVSVWVTIALVNQAFHYISLSWLLRGVS